MAVVANTHVPVVAVAFVGINLLPRSGSGPGGPLPSPSPTVAPSVSPQPTLARLPGSGPMEPGTYLMSDGTSSFRVTIPTGWDAAQNGRDIRKHRGQPGEVTLSLYSSDINVFPDACASQDRPPRTGPTADDLVAALRAQQNSDVSEPAGITIGGRPGQRLDVSTPQGLDVAGCFESTLRIWSGAAGGNYLAFGPPGETAPVSIVEAPSGRIVFTTAVDDTATAGDQADFVACGIFSINSLGRGAPQDGFVVLLGATLDSLAEAVAGEDCAVASIAGEYAPTVSSFTRCSPVPEATKFVGYSRPSLITGS